MTDHSPASLVAALLSDLSFSTEPETAATLRRYCHDDAVWEIFHPFNTLHGVAAASEHFWEPLQRSFPSYEHRVDFLLTGGFEGSTWVSVLGHVLGSFDQDWVGIPAHHRPTFVRFGLNAQVTGGKISLAHVYLDLIDVMHQTGIYPLRPMPGGAGHWPAPPYGSLDQADGESARSLQTIRTMQNRMGFERDDTLETEHHSPHWHPQMNWYGPAGIGTTRGEQQFFDYHCALFDGCFPDITLPHLFDRDPADASPTGGNHFIQIAEGRLVVTSGWPSLVGTHLAGGFLGMAPTGRRTEWRVADWYRLDADGLIIDNWVMIDVPYLLIQMGYDLLDDLRYIAAPATPRWPLRESAFIEAARGNTGSH